MTGCASASRARAAAPRSLQGRERRRASPTCCRTRSRAGRYVLDVTGDRRRGQPHDARARHLADRLLCPLVPLRGEDGVRAACSAALLAAGVAVGRGRRRAGGRRGAGRTAGADHGRRRGRRRALSAAARSSRRLAVSVGGRRARWRPRRRWRRSPRSAAPAGPASRCATTGTAARRRVNSAAAVRLRRWTARRNSGQNGWEYKVDGSPAAPARAIRAARSATAGARAGPARAVVLVPGDGGGCQRTLRHAARRRAVAQAAAAGDA